MRLKKLWIDGFKNLNNFEIDFESRDGITVLIGNNASGKSNILEAISAIFTSLYNPKLTIDFNYKIEYSITKPALSGLIVLDESALVNGKFMVNVSIESKKGIIKYQFRSDIEQYNTQKDILKHVLPSQVIALYSGEELRLWKNYYEQSYFQFNNRSLNSDTDLSDFKMLYINKYHWDIALLTMYASDMDVEGGIEKIIKGQLKTIKLEINIVLLEEFLKTKPNNVVNNFLWDLVRPDDWFAEGLTIAEVDVGDEYDFPDTISLDIENFKSKTIFKTHKELFYLLCVARLPKDVKSKLITDIELEFDNGITTKDLSEGQKKQILLKLALDILADENSLLLFDEPDAHIHIANKKLIPEMLKEYEGKREVILTTHSPTLTHSFDNKHLAYIENGKINENYSTQAKLLNKLTDGVIGVSEQQLFLQSNKDILIVEGKTDEAYISQALKILKINNAEYQNLEFNFLWLGGTDKDNLNKIIEEFTPKESQIIIAFFDRDDVGSDCIKKALYKDKPDSFNKDNFNGDTKNGIHIYFYPKKDGFTQKNFEVEDYFPIEVLRKFVIKESQTFQGIKSKFNKNKFSKECKEEGFDKINFDGFKKLFNLILEIKTNNSKK